VSSGVVQRGPVVDAARVHRHSGIEQLRHHDVIAGAGPARQLFRVRAAKHEQALGDVVAPPSAAATKRARRS
jgi:hypothetical protein